MKSIILLCLVAAVCSSSIKTRSALDSDWESFKTVHAKSYSISEEIRRRQIWEDTVDRVASHNREYDLGLHTYTLAVNKFADLTFDEFQAKHTGFKPSSVKPKLSTFKPKTPVSALPDSVDWRDKNIVTPVKDQGDCGSCWAFSTTGSLESQVALKKGSLVQLSEQNLVDCSGKQGNDGCNGGYVNYAFQYIQDAGGIDTESSYPYTGSDDGCNFNKQNIGASISAYTRVTEGDETAQAQAVVDIGPISVCIQVTDVFQYYSGGVLNDDTCSSDYDELNHCVLVVGYGSENGDDYWIVKNSWAADWGENGYLRMSRNKNNQCGIATDSWYPTLA